MHRETALKSFACLILQKSYTEIIWSNSQHWDSFTSSQFTFCTNNKDSSASLGDGHYRNVTDVTYWVIISGFGSAVYWEERWRLGYMRRTRWRWTPQRCGTSWLECSSSRAGALSCWSCRTFWKETTSEKVTSLWWGKSVRENSYKSANFWHFILFIAKKVSQPGIIFCATFISFNRSVTAIKNWWISF